MSRQHSTGQRPNRSPFPSSQRRTHRIGVRFSDSEWRRIIIHAKRALEQPGVFVRTSTLALIEQGGRLPVPPSRAEAERRRDLRTIGVYLMEMRAYVKASVEVESLLFEIETWIASQVRAR